MDVGILDSLGNFPCLMQIKSHKLHQFWKYLVIYWIHVKGLTLKPAPPAGVICTFSPKAALATSWTFPAWDLDKIAIGTVFAFVLICKKGIKNRSNLPADDNFCLGQILMLFIVWGTKMLLYVVANVLADKSRTCPTPCSLIGKRFVNDSNNGFSSDSNANHCCHVFSEIFSVLQTKMQYWKSLIVAQKFLYLLGGVQRIDPNVNFVHRN